MRAAVVVEEGRDLRVDEQDDVAAVAPVPAGKQTTYIFEGQSSVCTSASLRASSIESREPYQ